VSGNLGLYTKWTNTNYHWCMHITGYIYWFSWLDHKYWFLDKENLCSCISTSEYSNTKLMEDNGNHQNKLISSTETTHLFNCYCQRIMTCTMWHVLINTMMCKHTDTLLGYISCSWGMNRKLVKKIILFVMHNLVDTLRKSIWPQNQLLLNHLKGKISQESGSLLVHGGLIYCFVEEKKKFV
jgi:hypothetical protein